MKLSALEQRIRDIIAPIIEDLGYRFVRAKMKTENKRTILEVLVENPQTHNIGVDELAQISRSVSANLDVEDPISGAYDLEVSSPGIDRPLTRPEDFVIWIGNEAKIEIDPPLEGQKKFRGVLEGLDEQRNISLRTDQGMVALPLDSVHKAKLILTDALIEKTKAMQTLSAKKDENYGTGASR
jgi:ribosome maturation factor RimP